MKKSKLIVGATIAVLTMLSTIGYFVFKPAGEKVAAVTEVKKSETPPPEDPVAEAKTALEAAKKTVEEATAALTKVEAEAANATKKATDTPDTEAVAKAEANLEAAKKAAEVSKAKTALEAAKKTAEEAQKALVAAEKVVSDKLAAAEKAKKDAEEANATVPKKDLLAAQAEVTKVTGELATANAEIARLNKLIADSPATAKATILENQLATANETVKRALEIDALRKELVQVLAVMASTRDQKVYDENHKKFLEIDARLAKFAPAKPAEDIPPTPEGSKS